VEPSEVHTEETRPKATATDAEVTVLSTMVNATALIAEGVEAIAVVGTGPVATVGVKAVAETGTKVLAGTVEKKMIMPLTIDAAQPTVRPMMM
jgi:glutamate dehydrogenase/leucine dehydrogenase